jgi:hypothetical protein
MADAPFISGSDILNNSGNAALGIGSGAVPYVGNPANTEPFKGISDAYNTLQQQQAQKDLIDYKNKLDQQDQLAKTLAKFGGGAFNITDPVTGKNTGLEPLPEDKQILQQKADSIRRQMLENPDGYQFDEKLLQDQDEYNNLLRHASMRAFAKTNAYQDAAKEQDPDERQAILDNAKNEIDDHSLTDYYQPKPYFPAAPFDEMKIYGKDAFNDKNRKTISTGTQKDANGNLQQVNKTGYGEDVIGLNGRIIPGTDAYTEAKKLQKKFARPEFLSDPNLIRTYNQEADQVNQQRGWVNAQGVPTNANYVEHLGEIDPKTGQVIPNLAVIKDVRRFANAVLTPRHAKLTNDADIYASADELATSTASRLKNYADIEKFRREGKDEEADNPEAILTAKNTNDVFNSLQSNPIWDSKQEGFDKVSNGVVSKKPITSEHITYTIPLKDDNGKVTDKNYKLNDILQGSSIYNKDPLISVPINDDIIKIGGEHQTAGKDDKPVPLTKRPDHVYYSKDDDPRKDKMIFVYDLDGQPYAKEVSRYNGAVNAATAGHNFANDKSGLPVKTGNEISKLWGGGTSGQQPKRPTSVPKNAVWKQNKKTGSFGWVDNENRKVYDKDGKPLN